jgi:hypothetical protein
MNAWRQIQDALRQCRVRRKRAIAGNRPFLDGNRPETRLVLKEDEEPPRKRTVESRNLPAVVEASLKDDEGTDLMRLARLQLVASRCGLFDQTNQPKKERADEAIYGVVKDFKFTRTLTRSSPPSPKRPVAGTVKDKLKSPQLTRAQRAMLLPFALDMIDEAVRAGRNLLI